MGVGIVHHPGRRPQLATTCRKSTLSVLSTNGGRLRGSKEIVGNRTNRPHTDEPNGPTQFNIWRWSGLTPLCHCLGKKDLLAIWLVLQTSHARDRSTLEAAGAKDFRSIVGQSPNQKTTWQKPARWASYFSSMVVGGTSILHVLDQRGGGRLQKLTCPIGRAIRLDAVLLDRGGRPGQPQATAT